MSDNTIQLTSGYRHEEALAASAITPGHLIELIAAGTLQVHSTEGGFGERAWAVEDALQGNTIDDAYAADDLVMYNLVDPGDEVYGYIKAGEDIAIGDKLISAGDGTLIENGSESSGVTVRQIMAIALAALDLTGSAAVDTRVRCRVL